MLKVNEIQTGACRFCGQVYQFETDGTAREEQLDKWAEEKCDCTEAKIAKRMVGKAVEVKEAIEGILGDSYDEYVAAAEVVALGAELIVEEKIKKVVVDIGDGLKLSAAANASGFIKIEANKSAKKGRVV